jgi:anti-sigma-K factor RskA
MSHEPYSELASAYALGALEGEERSRFEAHLQGGCRECETALIEYGESLAALVAELPPATPPPSVKATLLRRLDAQARPARALELPHPRRTLWRFVWTGALAAAAVVVGYLGVTVNSLNRELTQRAEEVAALRAQVAQQREFLALFSAPETQVVTLDGLKPSPTGRGRMWWHTKAGGFFIATGLPLAPSGKTYQLWAIVGGKPVSVGVFDLDPKGSGTLRAKTPPGVEKVEMFAVTLEPAGGLPAPSGEMYLAGKAL